MGLVNVALFGYPRIYPHVTAEHNGRGVRQTVAQRSTACRLGTREQRRKLATLDPP